MVVFGVLLGVICRERVAELVVSARVIALPIRLSVPSGLVPA